MKPGKEPIDRWSSERVVQPEQLGFVQFLRLQRDRKVVQKCPKEVWNLRQNDPHLLTANEKEAGPQTVGYKTCDVTRRFVTGLRHLGSAKLELDQTQRP